MRIAGDGTRSHQGAGDTIIASPDGSELYVFNPRGRHERTVDTLAKDDQDNPIVIWEFNYDDAETGFLTSVTDRDGNVTRSGSRPQRVGPAQVLSRFADRARMVRSSLPRGPISIPKWRV